MRCTEQHQVIGFGEEHVSTTTTTLTLRSLIWPPKYKYCPDSRRLSPSMFQVRCLAQRHRSIDHAETVTPVLSVASPDPPVIQKARWNDHSEKCRWQCIVYCNASSQEPDFNREFCRTVASIDDSATAK